MSIPTNTTNNRVDAQTELQSLIETHKIELKNLKIDLLNWSKLVADKREEYEELTEMCSKKYCYVNGTASLSNPSKVDDIVIVSSKEIFQKRKIILLLNMR